MQLILEIIVFRELPGKMSFVAMLIAIGGAIIIIAKKS